MKIRDLGEFKFIERVAKNIKLSNCVVKGIGDDTAVLRYTKDKYLLFTTDMLVEGRHFYRKHGGYLIGRKSLSVNISDIASMGGVPTLFLVSLGVPPSLEVKFVDELYRGIKDVAKKFKIDLVGGDTVASDKLIVNISLLGEVEKKNLVLRSGAKDKDAIFVTGTIGGSLKGAHLSFTPRTEEARFLAKSFNVHSMIDISDGLLADLGHILEMSKAGAFLYEKEIPVSKYAKDFESAIREGEDFELLFTISKQDAPRLKRLWRFKTKLSMVGEIYKGTKGIYLVKDSGRIEKVKPTGYCHF